MPVLVGAERERESAAKRAPNWTKERRQRYCDCDCGRERHYFHSFWGAHSLVDDDDDDRFNSFIRALSLSRARDSLDKTSRKTTKRWKKHVRFHSYLRRARVEKDEKVFWFCCCCCRCLIASRRWNAVDEWGIATTATTLTCGWGSDGDGDCDWGCCLALCIVSRGS